MANYRRRTPDPQNFTKCPEGDSWSVKYGERHRLRWITDFPAGISPPKKPRIYARSGHFIVQWWDPAAKGNLCERVNGDLVDALAVAREVDRRLEDFRTSGRGRRHLQHRDLVERYLADLRRRADAGELAPTTVDRYAAALAHYLTYTGEPAIRKAHPTTVTIGRPFAQHFLSFLNDRPISPNGHPNSPPRRMRGQQFVLSVVSGMLNWASDPDQGDLLPAAFRNPFRRGVLQLRQPVEDQTAQLDIAISMARDFLEACDDYQLRLFASILFFGLRPSELGYLFREHVEGDWLVVPCVPRIGYLVKGRRTKRVPVLAALRSLLDLNSGRPQVGLLFLRRAAAERIETPLLLGAPLEQLIDEFDRRCQAADAIGAQERQQIRDQILHSAGGLDYDRTNNEFHRIARQLHWPASATLKDFRHLFSTSLANTGVSEVERRYLLGHSPGRDAIVRYTHLTELGEHYQAAAESVWAPLLDVVRHRCGLPPGAQIDDVPGHGMIQRKRAVANRR